ncbi:Neurochondrin-domain-containing protein [Gigaspora margarita]|uniref:Neurochondrin-domain-containing protein n=1 Tax=Gigaspora margarita TaxID=4874 RepID=A0A8H4AE12_GIGMA|nr:Neurochondrin-domain-containing protein [Gigaspora margarita]
MPFGMPMGPKGHAHASVPTTLYLRLAFNINKRISRSKSAIDYISQSYDSFEKIWCVKVLIKRKMANPQEHQSEIDRCIELLNPSSSDEAKFVALTLLPRLLKQDKKNVVLIFDAMDFKFLERLMRTGSVNDDNQPDFTLKSIAVNILSCFCALDELLNKKQIHARIPTLASLITPDNEELTRDILGIFLRLSSANQGSTYIIDDKVISKILQCITSFTNVEIQELALNVIYYTTTGVITSISQDQHISSSRTIIQGYISKIFKQLSDTFRINQNKLKFDLLQFFVQIFTQMSDQFVQDFLINDQSQTSILIQNFRHSLLEILSSKLGIEQRNKALSLVMLLLYNFGAIPLFAPITSNLTLTQISKSAASDIDNEFKFSALVVQLSCVEIRLMLDELEQEKKDDQLNERLNVMLPACYTILEKSIEYLSHIESLLESQEEVETTRVKLEPDVLLRLKGTMIETFRAIIEYLVDVKERGISIKTAMKDEKIIASIRVLSAWLAEESSLEKETLALMPFLVDTCRYW